MKKKLLNLGAFLIFLTIYTVPFLNWEKKNNTQRAFRDIEIEMYRASSLNNSDLFGSLSTVESRVNDFTSLNQVPKNLMLGDFISSSDTLSYSIKELRSDLYDKVNAINKFYRKSERKSNYLMYFFFIIGNGLLWLMRHYIKKITK
ncbi:MAG: hypothetical protein JEZ01_15150 [Labilibaculum sp.]|nr:hypothetical protein [Labilibaculum sp.]MBI9059099.1 hypothetical protein [Labilibaculum sp.]